MSVAIRCQKLIKTYPGKPPVEAVRGIDLDVPVGECFGLLGPNGAGKTTTMEMMEGLLDPTSGEIEILGMNWSRESQAIRERIGISLQETRLTDKLTVHEVVTLFRSFYQKGISPDEAIGLVSLQEKANARVDKLSGGQKQRLAVATALVGDPELLFLDEPTTGLDPQSRRQLWDVIRSFQARGRTVVITTHYMDEAERLCNRVAVVDAGKIIAMGTPRELIASTGGENVIEFTVESGTIDRGELASVEGITAVRGENETFTLAAAEPYKTMQALLDWLRSKSVPISGLTTRHATLEDVFVNLTGRHLRDDGAKS
ncbi:MAG: ABC transporter ATP-binding protein [Gemmataceae bacterium]